MLRNAPLQYTGNRKSALHTLSIVNIRGNKNSLLFTVSWGIFGARKFCVSLVTSVANNLHRFNFRGHADDMCLHVHG